MFPNIPRYIHHCDPNITCGGFEECDASGQAQELNSEFMSHLCIATQQPGASCSIFMRMHFLHFGESECCAIIGWANRYEGKNSKLSVAGGFEGL